MAKWIEYDYVCNASKGIFLRKKVAYNEVNLAIAKIESCNGSYTITDDSKDMEVNPIAIELGGTGAKTASDARKNLEVSQAIEDTIGCYYRMVDGEKEWINPPMGMPASSAPSGTAGAECRTTERFAGKPVYSVIVGVKAGSATMGSLGANFVPPTGRIDTVLRWSGWTNSGVVLPSNLHAPDSATHRRVEVRKDDVNTKAIRCTCYIGQDAVDANETWYIQLWYTKFK